MPTKPQVIPPKPANSFNHIDLRPMEEHVSKADKEASPANMPSSSRPPEPAQEHRDTPTAKGKEIQSAGQALEEAHENDTVESARGIFERQLVLFTARSKPLQPLLAKTATPALPTIPATPKPAKAVASIVPVHTTANNPEVVTRPDQTQPPRKRPLSTPPSAPQTRLVDKSLWIYVSNSQRLLGKRGWTRNHDSWQSQLEGETGPVQLPVELR